ncbi:MAG TPA: hypothetical protein DHW15_01990 [Bacteroidetes bacterium]|jgi:glycosyltransferase involved in cell wall biosynthesis|nr:MAG: hypothetical protein ABR94_12650 [Sphingobacteriales bacterium BACL12 MAG-120802-bin5]KRP10860.1 MAG: hypothetical protein ABR95_01220 [Sphingobacteriales bacterium BACL12 MAG-120813-bin55]HCK20959.1 hypothetical protein [Bacteroidota bacterium]
MSETSVAFLYPSHFPVTGGSSLHGYYLAKELTGLGYQLHTFSGLPDGFTAHHPQHPLYRLWTIAQSDIVYIRVSLEGKGPGLVPWLKRMGKRVVVELNGPTDELKVTRGATSDEVARLDAHLRKCLLPADAIITISDEMVQWCRQVIGHADITGIENGGYRYEENAAEAGHAIRQLVNALRAEGKQIILWSGNAWPWQGIEWLREIVEKAPATMAFILVSNEPESLQVSPQQATVHTFSTLPNADMRYLVAAADAGLAVYGDYSWFRTGAFYGSSLKMYEYLANRCWVAGNYPLSTAPHYANLSGITELLEWLGSRQGERVPADWPYRTWRQVAEETSEVIERVIL